jgi:hypothetical protein
MQSLLKQSPNDGSNTPTEDRALQFLSDAIAAFKQAESLNEGAVHHYRFTIAGQIIRVHIVGTLLNAFLSPALMHHILPDLSPELTVHPPHRILDIYAFDTHRTGVAMPTPMWTESAYNRKETLSGFSTERVKAAFNMGSGVFNLQDTTNGVGIYWIADSSLHPQFEKSSPLRVQLFWWLRQYGRHLIHGGAVSRSTGGLILVGRGGSGKSTSALACLNQGWNYIGDDYILFGLEPEPTAYNLYQSAKLSVAHFAKHFSHLNHIIADYTSPDRQDKAILMLQDRFPDLLMEQCPVRAIILPRVVAANTPRLTPISPQTSLAALLPSTLHQLPPVPPEDVRQMMQLVQLVPNYMLEIGGNPHEIPDMLATLVS